VFVNVFINSSDMTDYGLRKGTDSQFYPARGTNCANTEIGLPCRSTES
jgi:hypothetical protein